MPLNCTLQTSLLAFDPQIPPAVAPLSDLLPLLPLFLPLVDVLI